MKMKTGHVQTRIFQVGYMFPNHSALDRQSLNIFFINLNKAFTCLMIFHWYSVHLCKVNFANLYCYLSTVHTLFQKRWKLTDRDFSNENKVNDKHVCSVMENNCHRVFTLNTVLRMCMWMHVKESEKPSERHCWL